MKYLILLLILLKIDFISAKELVLPSIFDNNRVFLTPVLLDGKQIKFYTDSAGGWNAISTELRKKYDWKVNIKKENGREFKLTTMPEFREGKSIPGASKSNSLKGYLVVVNKKNISQNIADVDVDGFLGGKWFAEKIVFWDYIAKTVSILDSIKDVKNIKDYDKINLGFQKENGRYTTAFPSVEISVDGKILPMLFDTGATVHLSTAAKNELNETADYIGTSFITNSIFSQWQKDHPDWKVLEKADTLASEAMIEVPKVKIGNRIIGSVWFTRRADNNFHSYMHKMMDKKPEGAIGGSLFKYLRVIIDYPNEVVYVCD